MAASEKKKKEKTDKTTKKRAPARCSKGVRPRRAALTGSSSSTKASCQAESIALGTSRTKGEIILFLAALIGSSSSTKASCQAESIALHIKTG